LEHGTEWEAVSTLGADGLVSQFVNEHDPSAAFRLAGDRLLDPSGVTKATCMPDHALQLQGGTLALRFDADDALVDAEGTRIYVADSTFVEVRHGTTIAVHEGVWRVAGMTPATRRTAELLVLATMASVDWHSD